MAYDYEITDKAKVDIDRALNYIVVELSNVKAASNLIYEIEEAIKRICDYPFSYPDCSYFYIKDTNYRHAIIKNYTLVYYISKNKIIIIRFKHSRQNNILGR